MKCSVCDSKKALKSEKRNIKYSLSGLDNITIEGATVHTCDNCGEEYTQYGDLEKINQVIAKTLLKKDESLTGKEIRFLRTHKGYSAKKFSAIIRIEPETLYRAEGKESPVNEKLDLKVRLAIAAIRNDDDYSDVIDVLAHESEALSYDRIFISRKSNSYLARAV